MEIVIEISEQDYLLACNYPEALFGAYAQAIKNGVPLPKGHGELIDRKDLIENGISKGFCDWYDEIKMADTVIEAHKGETE